MTNEVQQTEPTVPYSEYLKLVTVMFYLFNFANDAAMQAQIDIENSVMKLTTELGDLGETALVNMFANADKLIYQATLSEGFEFVDLEKLVEPQQVEVVTPKLTLLS